MQYLNGFLSLRKYTGVAKLIDTPEKLQKCSNFETRVEKALSSVFSRIISLGRSAEYALAEL